MPENTPTFSTISTPSSYPASRKRYLQGSRSDVRVPYREITLSDTRHGNHAEANPPLPVYDTSGPYTDPEVGIRLTRGLPALRSDWIREREDTETLTRRSSEYARTRANDLLTFHLRFPSSFTSRRAKR
jgi:phosphomethylpyrimidine synthase